MTTPEIILTAVAVKILVLEVVPGLIGCALMIREWVRTTER